MLQAGRLQQRRITSDHNHRALLALQRGSGHLHRVPGTQLLSLVDRFNLYPMRIWAILQFGSNLIGFVTHDDDHSANARSLQSVEHVVDHRSATNGKQHFGEIAVHTSPFTGGQNYGDWVVHGAPLSLRSELPVSCQSAADLTRGVREKSGGEWAC